jgi:hypothetical protein
MVMQAQVYEDQKADCFRIERECLIWSSSRVNIGRRESKTEKDRKLSRKYSTHCAKLYDRCLDGGRAELAEIWDIVDDCKYVM